VAFEKQFSNLDWDALNAGLLQRGYIVIDELFCDAECENMQQQYDQAGLFRKTVNMAKHNFGNGEYKYFAYPLPELVQQIRLKFYAPLAKLANEWARLFDEGQVWPDQHQSLLDHCARAGQTKATPLMLKYSKGDYNRLHQDMYGEVTFPFQVIVLLSEPEVAFSGGDLILVENTPRMQSRAHLPKLKKGSAVIIPTQERPISGESGWRRAKMRHGVTELLTGERLTLGIIFHDA
jgi:hypothetical protein